MKKEVTEVDLLKTFVKEMEDTGATKEQIFKNIDLELLAEINNVTKANISLAELEKITDKCIAKEWLKHGSISEKYGYIVLTSSGNGIVRSLQIREEAKVKRSKL